MFPLKVVPVSAPYLPVSIVFQVVSIVTLSKKVYRCISQHVEPILKRLAEFKLVNNSAAHSLFFSCINVHVLQRNVVNKSEIWNLWLQISYSEMLFFSDSIQGPLIRFPSPPSLCRRRPLPAPILPQTPASQTGRHDLQGCPRETDHPTPTPNPTSAMEASTPSPYWGGRCLSLR